MEKYTIPAVRMALVTLVVLGLLYPLAVTGIAQLTMPVKANGSLVSSGGAVVGSVLIGQKFTQAKYFHGRPSAAGEGGYDAQASGASNLAPTSKALLGAVTKQVGNAKRDFKLLPGSVPVDMVTASGSGLDPDITPANAYAQVDAVAGARGMTAEAVRRIVDENLIHRQLGFLGEPRVNVLVVNMALDAAK